MKQATLPCAAPPPTAHPTDQAIDSYQHLPHDQIQYDASIHPALFDVHTPPFETSTPSPLSDVQRRHLDPQLQLDPALLSQHGTHQHDDSVIHVATPEPAPLQSTAAACSKTPTSLATHAKADKHFVQSPDAVESASKSHPPVHPFFRQGGASTNSTDLNHGSDSQHRRSARSSRGKARVSYREDLKAVLRADAAQEAARLNEEKRLAQMQAATAKKAHRSTKLNTQHQTATSKQQLHDAPGFELVEARVATSKPVEQTPLSLAVKGSGAAATANPHPFFTKKPKPVSPAQTASHPAPTQPDGRASCAKPSSSSFGSSLGAAPASWSLFSAPRSCGSKPKKPVNAPWPTQHDTHVVGLHKDEAELVSSARSRLSAFRCRWQHRTPKCACTRVDDDTAPVDFVTRMNKTRSNRTLSSIPLVSIEESFDTMDDFIAQHVDVSNLPPSLASTPLRHGYHRRQKSGQLWTDASRPHSAAECVGNESNAMYLLEWLRRLLVAAPGDVQTMDKKRKRGIQRRVDRKKPRRTRRGYSDDDDDDDDDDDTDDMADFVVDSDQDHPADEYDPTIADEEWFAKFANIERQTTPSEHEPPTATESQHTADGAVESARFASLDRLTNCMVLTGGCGTGKTASVYACAAELGYEVFELYPGMGKRSRKELFSAVGDLGRNHMVSSGGIGGGATFKTTSCASCASSSASTVRQSLILIEEADVVFEDDKGFWAAVVELIAESKRPVVVVCNHVDLVPVHDLPVQQVLEYHRPSVAEVVPWLQMVAAGRGRFMESSSVKHLVLSLAGTEDCLDEAGGEEELGVDVRQAIHQLQFGHMTQCCSQPTQPDSVWMVATAGGDMKAVASAAESRSLGDVLERGLQHPTDTEAWGDVGLESRCCRQLSGWKQLLAQPLASHQLGQTVASRIQLDYASTFVDLHNRLNPTSCCQTTRMRARGRLCQDGLQGLQARHASLLRLLVEPLFYHGFQCCSSVLPRTLVTDYGPFVRLMGLVDDDLAQIHASLAAAAAAAAAQKQQQQEEAMDSCSVSMRARCTRNSTRVSNWLTDETVYSRWLPLGPEQVHAARTTSLVFDSK